MAGPKLEVFKFGVYIFTPVMFMVYFGKEDALVAYSSRVKCAPEFYDKHVRNSKFWPAQEVVNTRTGIDRQEMLYEVERLKQERLARKAAREALSEGKDV
ncbi:hypothetical protein BG006_011057 [Podila minutissima]|uniref:Uncharacterized protein n=1 Tax=Podila minutissima TaxID=64525 RepID=A0A9P5SSE7_9FUNG|nr:hypothetical protein BG006_011057 [Podila minutissima]